MELLITPQRSQLSFIFLPVPLRLKNYDQMGFYYRKRIVYMLRTLRNVENLIVIALN